MLGKLMQYSIIHYGKCIPTDYPKTEDVQVTGGRSAIIDYRDLARNWLTPTPTVPGLWGLPSYVSEHRWYGKAGEHNRRFMDQDPWRYGMQHIFAPEIPTATSMAWNWQSNVDTAAKYLLTPVRAITLASTFKGKVLGTMNYLQCMVSNPTDETFDGRPLAILWCRDEWLEPFNSKSYRAEAVADLTAAARAQLARMRSR